MRISSRRCDAYVCPAWQALIAAAILTRKSPIKMPARADGIKCYENALRFGSLPRSTPQRKILMMVMCLCRRDTHSDVLAGVRAYRAWQKMREQPGFDFDKEMEICGEKGLSLFWSALRSIYVGAGVV